MFDDLRRAFKEAVDNFRTELDRDRVPENVDRLLRGMMEETAEAKARLSSLEDQLVRTRSEVDLEAREVETCLRREKMALDIDDEETAKVAAEYAARHLKRQQVLEQKAVALAQEIALRRGEVDEMVEKVKEARTRREELAATTGRSQARSALGGADDLFAELDRMAERIGDTGRAAEAAEELSSDYDDLKIDPWAPTRRPEIDYDAALAELKRRMGESEG